MSIKCFRQEMEKKAFLRCSAQFYGFRSEFVTSCLNRTRKHTESQPFLFSVFLDKFWPVLYILDCYFCYISWTRTENLKDWLSVCGLVP